MAEPMALIGALIAAVAGCAWLALAMQPHWEQVHGDTSPPPGVRHALRLLGWFGLLACGALCFAADRPSMAVLVWILLIAFAALATALTLAWKPRLLRFAFPAPRSAGR